MNIAVDGRVLNDTAGKAVYARSVLSAFKSATEHQFTVYGYSPSESDDWPNNWHFVELNTAWRRLNAFRTLKADVLFSPSSYLSTILSNIPTLTTVHDLVVYKTVAKLPLKTILAEKFLLKKALKKSKVVTVQTESIRNDLALLFPAIEPKIRVVKPGVSSTVNQNHLPVESAQKEILARLNVRTKYLLFVGTLEPRKNISRLVKAFESLSPELTSSVQLVLAGKIGWQDRQLSQTLSQLPESVVTTGRVSDSELATLYRNCLAVIYPSLYEGVGYPVLEGYYWQKPVITSNTSSMAEIGRGAAELIDPNSTESIGRAVSKLLTDPTLSVSLVEAGTERLQGYSWAETAEAYLEILAEIK